MFHHYLLVSSDKLEKSQQGSCVFCHLVPRVLLLRGHHGLCDTTPPLHRSEAVSATAQAGVIPIALAA